MGFGDSAGILFRIRSDSTDARQDIKRVTSEISNLAAIFTGNRLSGATSQVTSLGNAFTALPGPVGLAVGAIAGLAIGAVTAGIALFKISLNAAEFGSKIFDLTEKTGLAAETISSLKVAAEQSGSSIETVSAGLSKFAKLIGEAGAGSLEAQTKLNKLHVTSKDLDTALGQALVTIAAYPPGVEQMTAAQAAFGRSGADLLPFIKSFDGDLPALIAKCKELGLTMSNEDAAAADKFGDQMDTLNAQLAAVTRTIGTELMPVFHSMASDISSWLSNNKGEVQSWATTFANALKTAILSVEQEANDLSALYDVLLGKSAELRIKGNFQDETDPLTGNTTPFGKEVRANEEAIRKRKSESIRIGLAKDRVGKVNDSPFAGGETPDYRPLPAGPGDFEDAAAAKKAADEARKARDEARKRDLAAQKDHIQALLKIQSEWFESDTKGFEDAFLKKTITEQEWRETSETNYTIYTAKVKKLLLEQFKLDAQGKTPLEIATLRLEKDSANTAVDKEVARVRDDREKAITGFVKKETDERKKLSEDESRNQIAIARKTADTQQTILESNRRLGIITESKFAEEVGKLKLELLQRELTLETSEDRRKELDEEIKQQVIRNADAIIEAWQKEGIALLELMKLEEERRKRDELPSVPLPRPVMAEGTPDTGFWKSISDSMAQYLEGVVLVRDANGLLEFSFAQTFTTIKDMGMQAFAQLASGFGQMVANWVLYGNEAEGGLRKMLAGVLANLAAMATTYAIMCLAAAALATTVWGMALLGGTPTQFLLAAALFGAVAAGTALAGRAVAGNSFKKESGRATGGAGGGDDEGQGNGPGLNFTERFAGFQNAQNQQMAQMQDRTNAVLGGVIDAVTKFNNKFGVTTPDAVVMAGAGGASSQIFEAVQEHKSTDLRGSTQDARNDGRYR